MNKKELLFSEQYNENGISHFLVITIDKNQPREYIGVKYMLKTLI